MGEINGGCCGGGGRGPEVARQRPPPPSVGLCGGGSVFAGDEFGGVFGGVAFDVGEEGGVGVGGDGDGGVAEEFFDVVQVAAGGFGVGGGAVAAVVDADGW